MHPDMRVDAHFHDRQVSRTPRARPALRRDDGLNGTAFPWHRSGQQHELRWRPRVQGSHGEVRSWRRALGRELQGALEVILGHVAQPVTLGGAGARDPQRSGDQIEVHAQLVEPEAVLVKAAPVQLREDGCTLCWPLGRHFCADSVQVAQGLGV